MTERLTPQPPAHPQHQPTPEVRQPLQQVWVLPQSLGTDAIAPAEPAMDEAVGAGSQRE
ncbi:hypothetical protein [Acaryochloris thomasi]|uniref:hypothetical protein n=1 Tax=Acaryochloris thomasi TaxID=2929456 RepID=UPI0013141FF7|nr:hypothetical protein [Acaryochloris thomasi]